jgi:hypothetical protein
LLFNYFCRKTCAYLQFICSIPDLKPLLERKKEDPASGAAAASPRPDAEQAARAADAGRLTEEEEFVMGVADVLAGAGVEGPSREVVLEVVERLVSRLHIVQREKDTATDQIRGEKPFDKGNALIKKKRKFSSYIGKFRVEQLQSHI